MVMEITAYKQAQQVMAILKRHNELIMEMAGEGNYGLNMNGEAIFVNPAAANMMGWSAEEAIGGATAAGIALYTYCISRRVPVVLSFILVLLCFQV
ncbi:MAG: PAS domain-containing protein [Candidatus Polarisedimenticolaceae bacterium]|nr:PAS domain-containing protein [Candidatus Polarisedimenticolaceae bacterium]